MAELKISFDETSLRKIVREAITERFPALDAAVKLIKAAELWRDDEHPDGRALEVIDLLTAAVDEWRASQRLQVWEDMADEQRSAVLPVPNLSDRDVIDCRRTVTEET